MQLKEQPLGLIFGFQKGIPYLPKLMPGKPCCYALNSTIRVLLSIPFPQLIAVKVVMITSGANCVPPQIHMLEPHS